MLTLDGLVQITTHFALGLRAVGEISQTLRVALLVTSI